MVKQLCLEATIEGKQPRLCLEAKVGTGLLPLSRSTQAAEKRARDARPSHHGNPLESSLEGRPRSLDCGVGGGWGHDKATPRQWSPPLERSLRLDLRSNP